MSIRIKNEFDGKLYIKELEKDVSNILAKELQKQVSIIKRRTARGKDVEGHNFKPYTEQYKRFKQRRGRTGAVDLRLSGHMMNSLTSTVKKIRDGLEGLIFLRPSRGRRGVSAVDKARGNLENGRRFIGLNPKEIDRIAKALTKK